MGPSITWVINSMFGCSVFPDIWLYVVRFVLTSLHRNWIEFVLAEEVAARQRSIAAYNTFCGRNTWRISKQVNREYWNRCCCCYCLMKLFWNMLCFIVLGVGIDENNVQTIIIGLVSMFSGKKKIEDLFCWYSQKKYFARGCFKIYFVKKMVVNKKSI